MTKLSSKQGKELTELVRKSIKYFLALGEIMKEVSPKEFSVKQGVFVTLQNEQGELRGCIGFPYPTLPLWNAVIEAGVSAAFNDPRFNPLTLKELEEIKIEISVLTVPEEITGKKELIPEKIETGKDGLIIKINGQSGLLLPQVAEEMKWNSKTFLEQTCIKAGLNKDDWRKKECKIFKFQAQIFNE